MDIPPIPKIDHKSEAAVAHGIALGLIDQGWDVYGEVRLSEFLPRRGLPEGILDLAAIKGPFALAVEVKKSFSLTLLEQAIEWTKIFPLVAVAVPAGAAGNKKGLRNHLREYFGLGVYTSFGGNLSVVSDARLLRHNLRNVPDIRGALDERMKISVPGASATYRHSRYQDFVWYIRLALAEKGPMRQKELIQSVMDAGGIYHYSSAAVMKRQLHEAISSMEPDFALSAESIVTWLPEKCPHGAEYVERVRRAAGYRQNHTGVPA